MIVVVIDEKGSEEEYKNSRVVVDDHFLKIFHQNGHQTEEYTDRQWQAYYVEKEKGGESNAH